LALERLFRLRVRQGAMTYPGLRAGPVTRLGRSLAQGV